MTAKGSRWLPTQGIWYRPRGAEVQAVFSLYRVGAASTVSLLREMLHGLAVPPFALPAIPSEEVESPAGLFPTKPALGSWKCR